MDQSEQKYKRFMVTIRENKLSTPVKLLPLKEDVIVTSDSISDKWIYQLEECPQTKNLHYQGCIETRIRKRQQTLLNDIVSYLCCEKSQVQIDKMEGSWEQAQEYCTKKDSQMGEPFMSDKIIPPYMGNDVNFLGDPARRYSWQNSLFNKVFNKVPSDVKIGDGRSIYWVSDTVGNSGKSVFTKYICFHNTSVIKISFATASQLRSAVISAGPRKLYILDIPRTLGRDENIDDLLSVLEDVLGGYVTSSFYGKTASLMWDPPQVIVFSNNDCPVGKLSQDRWNIFKISDDKKLLDKSTSELYYNDIDIYDDSDEEYDEPYYHDDNQGARMRDIIYPNLKNN